MMPLARRILIVWALVAVFFYWAGGLIVHMVLPWLEIVTNLLAKNYHADLSIGTGTQGTVINILATVTSSIYQYNIPIAPKGAQLAAAGTLAHALTPLVIFFALIFSWPGSFKAVLTRAFIGVPIGIAILSATMPFLLTSHIEEIFHSALQTVAQKNMPLPFVMTWVILMEMGGLWLLPIIGALGCVVFSRQIKPL
jgi:hypothetical protein